VFPACRWVEWAWPVGGEMGARGLGGGAGGFGKLEWRFGDFSKIFLI
jgi:hypothetical protein